MQSRETQLLLVCNKCAIFAMVICIALVGNIRSAANSKIGFLICINAVTLIPQTFGAHPPRLFSDVGRAFQLMRAHSRQTPSGISVTK